MSAMSGTMKEPRRAPVLSSWLITAHALERYVERVHRGISFRQALEELRIQLNGAHRNESRKFSNGLEEWRGPKPRRIRIRVRRDGDRLEVVTVIPAWDGLAR